MSRIKITAGEWQKDVRLRPPRSKSDAVRILLLKYIRQEEHLLGLADLAQDVKVVLAAINKLEENEQITKLHMALGGAPLRLTTGLCAFIPGKVFMLDAEESLRTRPHENLFDALRQSLGPHGLKLHTDSWPIKIDTTELKLPSLVNLEIKPTSGQFVTALALGAAYAIAHKHTQTANIRFLHAPVSKGYIDLTFKWLSSAGFEMNIQDSSWLFTGYDARPWRPEYPLDWSSAAYLLIWSWISGSTVRLPEKHQPDAIIVDILSEAGLRIVETGEGVQTAGKLENGIVADASQCPDLIPTLAAVALVAPEPSSFHHVDVLRVKESNRLEFIEEMVQQAGGSTRLNNGTMTIVPPKQLAKSFDIKTKNDHRRAMTAALLIGLGAEIVIIDDDSCVDKSFPSYWRKIENIGVQIEQLD